MDIDFWSAFHGASTTSWMPPLTRAGAREHPRPMLMQRFGARAQPGASALRPRVLLTVPVRVSYTPRASPDIPSHHARSVDSRTPHTESAHADRHRPRCPSTRNPSNIYPNHGRTPRHHRARAARSPWAIVAWCSCGCSCACTSTATTASMCAWKKFPPPQVTQGARTLCTSCLSVCWMRRPAHF